MTTKKKVRMDKARALGKVLSVATETIEAWPKDHLFTLHSLWHEMPIIKGDGPFLFTALKSVLEVLVEIGQVEDRGKGIYKRVY